jgi:radical SAM superfamily enzyme YgiQ (UPF0313 family)
MPPSPQKRKIVRAIDCSFETKANYLWQPNDFMNITSLLKPEDDVVFIDGTADSLSDDEFFIQVHNVKKGDLLFFALSSVCFNSDLACFKKVREIFPDTPMFVIGDLFIEKEYRESILHECDGIVYQPYQLDLEQMKNIRSNPHPDIKGLCTKPDDSAIPGKTRTYKTDNGSFPRHEIFLKSGYSFPFARHFQFATVTAVWGCPFACSYCTDANYDPYPRNSKNVIRELEHLEKLGVKELFFADKSFGHPYEIISPMLEEMAKRFTFSWACYHHPNLYKPELLELMKKAGCHTIITGIDTYNYDSLKSYNRHVSKEKVEAMIFHADKLKIDVCADFIFGLEHETAADLERTIEYSMNIPLDFASFNIASPLPGSSIREKALLDGKIKSGEDNFDTLGNKKILGNVHVTADQLRKLRVKAVRSFYLRPSYIFRRLSRINSLEHLSVQLLEMASMFKKLKVNTHWS